MSRPSIPPELCIRYGWFALAGRRVSWNDRVRIYPIAQGERLHNSGQLRTRQFFNVRHNMKRQYMVGVAISSLGALATLGIKAIVSRYPGVGDFSLLNYVGELLPRPLNVDGRLVLCVAKVVLAGTLFSALFIGLKKIGNRRLLVALALTTAALVAMSLGEAVVG